MHPNSGQSIPHALTPPPFRTETFVGRKTELAEIRKRLAGGHPLLLVNGNGGIGKTTLAARYYFDEAENYRHVAWVLSEKNMADAVLKIAPAMGVRFDERADTETRFTQLIPLMNQLPGPCLLVIDNANEIDDLEKQYRRLRQCANFHILLTTRITHFRYAEFYRIEGLPEAEALDLFQTYFHALDDEGLAIFKAIRQAVNGNTLVLELLAKNLRLKKRYGEKYGLPELLDDLQTKGLLQLRDSSKVATDYQNMEPAKPEDIIAAMYDLTDLPDAEQQMLSIFAVLPAENIPFKYLEKLLPENEGMKKGLISLADKGWLEFNEGEDTFKCSPVVQVVTKVKSENIAEDCRPLIHGLIKGLGENVRHLDNYLHSSIFAEYGASVMESLKVDDDDLGTLCQNVGEFHKDTGDINKMMDAYQQMVEIQKGLFEKEPENADFKNGLAISYSKLGETHTSLGNLHEALQFFKKYNRLEKELHEDFPNNVRFKNSLAISYEKLGETHTSLGNLQEALRFFNDDAQLTKELFEAYPNNVSFMNGLAISYSKLGETHTSLGNLEEALKFFNDETELFEELFETYPYKVSFKNGLAISFSKLGETHASLGNLHEALRFFNKYNRLEKELYEACPNNVGFKKNLATSYSKLGDMHTSLRNLNEALKFFNDDAQLAKELFEAYPNNVSFMEGLAVSYGKLGETHASLRNLHEALRFFNDGKEIFEVLFEVYPNNVSFMNGLGTSYSKLGETHASLGNLHEALRFFNYGTEIFEELFETYPYNVSFKNGLAISYEKLGETHTSLGNIQEALQFFTDDAQLTKELFKAYPNNVSFRNGLAVSYAKLGEFYRDHQKDMEEAKSYFLQCHEIWKEMVTDYPGYVEFQRNFEAAEKALRELEGD